MNLSPISGGGKVYDVPPNLGKTFSEEHRQKMSENHPKYWVGKKRPKHSEKIRGKGARLDAFCPKTGELVHKGLHCYQWVELGFNGGNPLLVAKGQRKTAGGLIWKFSNE